MFRFLQGLVLLHIAAYTLVAIALLWPLLWLARHWPFLAFGIGLCFAVHFGARAFERCRGRDPGPW